MSKHSRGPLAAVDDGDCIRICTADDRDWIIAEMEIYATLDPDLNDEVQMANATLYAAAPDLLEACKAFMAVRENYGCGFIESFEHDEDFGNAILAMESAVAKATEGHS